MSQSDLNQTPSEESTLKARGYTILNKLGEGSFAKVFLAEYHSADQTNILACKIIDIAKASKDIAKKFFPRELNILLKLNHPHLVQIHSIFQKRSKYFIFMRYAENGDLLEFILKHGAVSEGQARIWTRQLALGLQYLHEMEIAHRDIKCENVLLTVNFNAKLADFGFARYVTDSRGKRVLSDTFCGSLLYAAPEILKGTPYNPKISDLWSLGVIVYILLNKAMPFDDTNLQHLYHLQTHRKWKFHRKVVGQLSEDVKKLITNLLEPDMTRRWKLDQIINSSWICKDPRLLVLTPAEQAALTSAINERKKLEEKLTKKQTIIFRFDQEEKNETPQEPTANDIGKTLKSVEDQRISSAFMETTLES